MTEFMFRAGQNDNAPSCCMCGGMCLENCPESSGESFIPFNVITRCVVPCTAHTPVIQLPTCVCVHMLVCVVLSRSSDEHVLLRVKEAAAAERLLWSWLEVLVVPGWDSI